MTHLDQRKNKMKIETAARIGSRALVIEFDPTRSHELFIRERGRQIGYWVPLLAIYSTGAKIAERERRAERTKRKA